MTKAINRFDPVARQSFEASERHYLEVHHPFARKMHREADIVQRYVANRALSMYDINGEFSRAPLAWRYVIQLRRDDLPDAQSFLPRDMREAIWNDHINCIRNIRSLEVEAETVLDRCTGQMVFVKYLFEFHGNPTVSRESGEAWYVRDYLPAMRKLLAGAFGFRKLDTNRALRQAAVTALKEPGQILTGEYLPPESVYRIEEYWFDNATWGGDFFRDPAVLKLLNAPQLGRLEGYLVEERCGVDKF